MKIVRIVAVQALGIVGLVVIGIPACIGDPDDPQDTATGGAGGADGGGDPCSTWEASAGKPCSLVSQCGCDETMNCVLWDEETTACVPVGTVAETRQCASGSSTECQRGLACVGWACAKTCDTVEDCPGENRRCVCLPQLACYCSTMCDLVFPGATCGLNVGCWPVADAEGYTECSGKGNGLAGGPCRLGREREDCGPGHICASGLCRKWCVAEAGTRDCPNGKSCGAPYFKSVTGINYGICPL
jgi:hypothetical protein